MSSFKDIHWQFDYLLLQHVIKLLIFLLDFYFLCILDMSPLCYKELLPLRTLPLYYFSGFVWWTEDLRLNRVQCRSSFMISFSCAYLRIFFIFQDHEDIIMLYYLLGQGLASYRLWSKHNLPPMVLQNSSFIGI
jgi:hypothetical protein